MTDKQDKNFEQLAEETAAGESLQDAGSVEEEAPHVAPAAPRANTRAPVPPAAPARKGSSVVAWLALLLALVVAGGLGWLLREQQQWQSGVATRLQALEATARTEQAGLDQLGQRWQGQLNGAVEQLQAGTAQLGNQVAQLADTQAAAQAQLAEQRAELARYSANDRDDWLLAEAEYLLRLANQRLIMAGDVAAAQALLGSADSILLELDDSALHGARGAVAADLAALRAVPRVDVEGTYLRLAALVEQADQLVIFQLPAREAQPTAAAADSWQARLRQGYEAALAKLSNYIIIRRRDVPMQALMDPQWEGLVRQNLRMLLEQAQVALLSGNQTLYRASLERARHWVGEFFASDEAAAAAMSGEINRLIDVTVAASLPDLSRSLQALDEVVQTRLQQGGEE